MEIIKHQFSWESGDSHEVFWHYRKRSEARAQTEVADMVTLCNLRPPASVLDIGCGLGCISPPSPSWVLSEPVSR